MKAERIKTKYSQEPSISPQRIINSKNVAMCVSNIGNITKITIAKTRSQWKQELVDLKSRNNPVLVKKKEKHYRQSGTLLFMILKTLDSYLYMKPNLAKNQQWIRRST